MKLLIVKTSSIGDVIQTFPVLRYLRQKFPKAQIDWVVEKAIAPLLMAHPFLNRVIIFDSKKWRKTLFHSRQEIQEFYRELRRDQYDLLFDLQGNSKSALITFFAQAEQKVGLGWNSVAERLNYFVTTHRYDYPKDLSVSLKYLNIVQTHFKDHTTNIHEPFFLKITPKESERLDQILNKSTSSLRMMICFGSKWRNKMLDPDVMENFLDLIDRSFHPSFLFIYGNEEEKQYAEKWCARFTKNSQAVGNLSIPLWQQLMHRMDLLVAMDSAALNLCGTTKTPSFSVFGPSLARAYKPDGKHHVAFQGSCPYDKKFTKRCSILRTCKTGACIRFLDAEELFQAFSIYSDRFIKKDYNMQAKQL